MLHVLALAKLLCDYLWFLFGVIQTFMLWFKYDSRKINVCVHATNSKFDEFAGDNFDSSLDCTTRDATKHIICTHNET